MGRLFANFDIQWTIKAAIGAVQYSYCEFASFDLLSSADMTAMNACVDMQKFLRAIITILVAFH
jgi:hypothetical protein